MTRLLTRTGQVVDLAAPRPETIKLADIALALSRTARFGGHTRRNWTVADHSLLVVELMPCGTPPDLLLAALLHDAHEAYTGDVTVPMAHALDIAGRAHLHRTQSQLDIAIARAFALHPGLFEDPTVQAADALAFGIEARVLMEGGPANLWPDCPDLPTPLPALAIRGQLEAQNHYLIRAFILLGQRHGVDLSPDLLAPASATFPPAPARLDDASAAADTPLAATLAEVGEHMARADAEPADGIVPGHAPV